MSLKLRGIKARPHDLQAMLAHDPSLVELHCSVEDLRWEPPRLQSGSVPLAVHLPEFDRGRLLDPAALDEAQREDAAAVYVAGVRAAARWGTAFPAARPKVVFHPGGNSVEAYTLAEARRARVQLFKTVGAMQQAARECGGTVEVLVENLPAHCWFFNGDWLASMATEPTDLLALCAELDLGLTLDLCHLYLASQEHGFDPYAAVERLRPLVRHVHYSGAKGVAEEGLQVGEGDFDVARALGLLADVDAVAVPEIWYGHEDNGAKFLEAWSRVEQALTAPAGG